MFKYLFCLLMPLSLLAQPSQKEITRWENTAAQVSIVRDHFGVPHIYGKTDAQTVFGLLYAQCEDDFKRVEMNYIEKLGRLSEVKGSAELYNDLLIRLIIDSADAKKDFENSPAWLKQLLQAYADGINFYLYKHPQVKPALLTRFEPWYQLLWTDGSIGAIDVGDVTVGELKALYGGETNSTAYLPSQPKIFEEPLPSGSNGFAFGPSKTKSGNAILYINPHVTFYFRPEVAMESQEGLHAYGAVTWGQFFIYQGFNENCGWMHTSGYADVADLYQEQVLPKDGGYVYSYEKQEKKVGEKIIDIQYVENGKILSKSFKTYFTHHGPVMAKRNGQWISVRSNNRSLNAIIQSWKRTKAKGFEEYKQIMELRSNTSNNTVFADSKGNIAYWHGNFIPKRDAALNWSKPVDGSTKATEWQGLHSLDEMIHVYNPTDGWLQNCNSTPFTVAGTKSPLREKYPRYMATDGENFRGINAVKIFNTAEKYNIDDVIKNAYNSHLAAFDLFIPALISANEKYGTAPRFASLQAAISLLGSWNRNSSDTSVATTLAIEWAQKLWPAVMRQVVEGDESNQVAKTQLFLSTSNPENLLQTLSVVLSELESKFGTWRKPWGSINRYQRLTGNLTESFDDNKPSLPDGFAASTWGCLPSFVSRPFSGTKLRYGYNGNSFICAVEFGKRVVAKSLLAGGNASDPASSHFGDQAEMYTKGRFKDVLFYKEDVLKNAERTYKPGE